MGVAVASFQQLSPQGWVPDDRHPLTLVNGAMIMNVRIRLKITVSGIDTTSEHFAECCGQGCGVHDIEKMSQCVECGMRFCMEHDCECSVDMREVE